MKIAPDHLYTWDFWTIVDDSGLNHVFFLQAPRDLYNPENRHNQATVGHAVSRDMKTWEYRGTVVNRGVGGSWNDMAIWTGSVTRTHMGDYVMMVTGRTFRDAGSVQRLGLYFSRDLYSWHEYAANPVIVCDDTLYWPSHHIEGTTTWRDPWLYADGASKDYHAFITAQRKREDGEIVGCIATAHSRDSTRWSVGKPLGVPEYFRVLECPQIRKIGQNYILFVNVDKRWRMPDAPDFVPATTGTHAFVSQDMLKGYVYAGVVLDGGLDIKDRHVWERYQLVMHDEAAPGILSCVHWDGYHADGTFAGGLSEVVTLDAGLLSDSAAAR